MNRYLVKGLQQASLLLLLLGLAGCAPEQALQVKIGTLTGSSAAELPAGVREIAVEQEAGYMLAADNLGLDYPVITGNEGSGNDDVQVSFRSLVEDGDVAAIIGATTDGATMRSVSLANFFNVPMVVPSAGGDNLLPSNNLWAFRLSAPSSSYASYIFGSLILKPAPLPAAEGEPVDLAGKLAIVYEQTTFGESAAVAAAHAAMDLSMEITIYQPFPAESKEPLKLEQIAGDIFESGAHLVYMVCSDPEIAQMLASAVKDQYQNSMMPVLLGMEGGFATNAFINSQAANGVYLVRQAIDRAECPQEIETIYQAKSYAGIVLLEKALTRADEQQPEQSRLDALTKTQVDLLSARRENVRDILKGMTITLPCLGQVSFDTTGQNKNQAFEVLLIEDGSTASVTQQDFRAVLEQVVVRGILQNE